MPNKYRTWDPMSDAADSIQSPERLRRHAIASLVPFFIDGPDGDPMTARLAAEGMLDGYNATTSRELQLSTQIIALGWAAMACLRAAVAAKNLSTDEVLRLQDDAIKLDRSCQKAAKALDLRRKERARTAKTMNPANVRWDEGVFQLAINQALEKLMAANDKLAAYTASLSSGTAEAAKAAPQRGLGEQMTRAEPMRRGRK
jgi:hypothetical protein